MCGPLTMRTPPADCEIWQWTELRPTVLVGSARSSIRLRNTSDVLAQNREEIEELMVAQFAVHDGRECPSHRFAMLTKMVGLAKLAETATIFPFSKLITHEVRRDHRFLDRRESVPPNR